MRWRLEEIARREMRLGRKVVMSYGMLKIDKKWWRWEEEEEVLVDGKRLVREGGKNKGEIKEV